MYATEYTAVHACMQIHMHVYVVGLNTSVPEPQYRSPPMMSTRGKRQKF